MAEQLIACMNEWITGWLAESSWLTAEWIANPRKWNSREAEIIQVSRRYSERHSKQERRREAALQTDSETQERGARGADKRGVMESISPGSDTGNYCNSFRHSPSLSSPRPLSLSPTLFLCPNTNTPFTEECIFSQEHFRGGFCSYISVYVCRERTSERVEELCCLCVSD